MLQAIQGDILGFDPLGQSGDAQTFSQDRYLIGDDLAELLFPALLLGAPLGGVADAGGFHSTEKGVGDRLQFVRDRFRISVVRPHHDKQLSDRPVAVLLSTEEYQRLDSLEDSIWAAKAEKAFESGNFLSASESVEALSKILGA